VAARTIHPNVQKVNANLPNANFPPILLRYLEIALACEVPGPKGRFNYAVYARAVKKLERAEDKERMMVRFDEEDPSGAPVSVRDRDGESAASAAE
jgi:hypothetical protein